MKCNELKTYNVVVTDECADYICGQKQLEFEAYAAEDVDAAIAELKAKLEDVQATAYVEIVDAGMENRRLKRALWLARAERAVAEQTVDEWSRYKEKHPFGSWRADPFEYWMQAWICVEKICRKKAEEY